MNRTAAQLLEDARTLPPDEQLWLADALHAGAYDEAWGKEIKHRLDEIDSGKVELIPGEKVRDEMLQLMSPEARERYLRDSARLAS
jgi:hypothetical protein